MEASMERVLKHKWFNSLILLISLLAITQSGLASTFMVPADDDLIISARAIVTGKVLSIESSFDDQQERIYTYITIKVREVIKGQITDRKIVIKEMGGQVGNRGFTLYGNPEFRLGENVLLYLDTWNDGSLRTHQLFLGKFSIVKDEATGHEFVVRQVPDDNVTVLRPQSQNGQPDIISTDRMELSTYVEMVRNRLNVNLERSQQFQDTYYSNTPMLRQPAEFDKVNGHGDVHADWTYISSQHPRWFEPDSGQPVTFMINPAGAPNAEVMNDVVAAMNAWSNTPGTSLRIVSGGTTGACRETFGLNLILFNTCDGRWSPTSGCSSTLALGGLGWTGNTTIINGVIYRQATAGFVSFNPFAACSFGNHCNVQEVATHELGHAMGLGHSADSTATMFAFAHFDGRCASLKPDDIAGITTIYPGTGGGGPGPLSVVTSSLAGGTVASAYSQTLSATGGTPPYSWSLASGALPPGLTLTPVGIIAGLPLTAGTFNFTVQVADSASGTAQKALSIAVTAAGTQYDSLFLSQTVPSTLTPGQTFNATVSWLNTGTQTWQGATGLRLLSQNPFNNVNWGGNTVLLTNFTVPPGGQLDLTFQAVAPTTPGTYNFQWQVARDASTPFGQMSTNVSIQVGSGGGGGGGTNNAAFVTQSVPSSMTAGQVTSVSVTMQNTGTTTWAAGTYFLGSRNPTGNSTWGLSQVALASSVAPGGQATFTFNIAAPSLAGAYNFQWGMLQNGVGAFGAASTNVSINVTGGGGGNPNSAQFISQILPATWTPGQTYAVTINMKNTGTTNWSPLSYKLGSQTPTNNTNWGMSRVTLAKSISPGSTASFKFNVTVPTTPGTYNFQWQLVQDSAGFFGDMTLNVPVTVGGGGGGGGTNGASFMTQSVPSSMTAGQAATVSVTMQNTGTTTWAAGTYFLGSRNSDNNTTWGLSQVALASSVAPGGQATFTFNVNAPAAAGTYNFQWGMKQNSVFFGSSSTNVAVNVTSGGGGGGGTNGASFVTQSVPSSLNTGQTTSVSVTMQNTGTTTWAAGTYSLQSQNPAGNTTWGLNRVNLASSVAPGSNATFTFNITAPAAAGTYNFQWRMAQDGVGAFGNLSTNVAVTVSQPGGGGGPLAITTSTLASGIKGTPYSSQVAATGGTPSYTWSIASGGLPAGLTLNSGTGVISGTPTAAGGFSFVVMLRDQLGQTASKSLKITINSR
jgi:uncharacterized membrane protein